MYYDVIEGISKDIVIPSTEVEMSGVFKKTPTTTPLDQLFKPFIQELAVSPTGELVAWQENHLYCDNDSIYCYGIEQLKVSEFGTERSKTLLEIPLNNEEGGINLLENLSWSPNAQYLFIRQSVEGHDRLPIRTPILFDMETEKILEMPSTKDLSDVIGWSPDQNTIVWSTWQWPRHNSSGDTIRFCTIQSRTCRDVKLTGLWNYGLTDWRPDGKSIVFAAASVDPQSYVYYKTKLYLLELKLVLFKKYLSTLIIA
jgi:hypothetical protein